MSIRIFGLRINISPVFCFLLCFVLCIDPSGVSLFSFIAIISHEIGHLIAMTILGCKPEKVDFKAVGIEISANKGSISYNKELIVDLSGCAMNLMIFSLCYILYKINPYLTTTLFFGVVNLVVAVFNLMPVFNMDGGDVLKNIFCRKFSAEIINVFLTITTIFSAIFMIILGIYCYIYINRYPIPAISGIYFIILLILHYKY